MSTKKKNRRSTMFGKEKKIGEVQCRQRKENRRGAMSANLC
jgi:hypothetical protein